MNTPARSAAAISISVRPAVAGRPSRTKETTSLPASAIGAASLFDVEEELVAEHADGRGDRRRDRRAEDADRRLLGRPVQPGGDVVRDVEEQVEVLLPPAAGLQAGQDPLEPTRSL